MTGYEAVMSAVLARLKAAPANWGLGVQDVRRAHRTAVPRTAGITVHLIGGRDQRATDGRSASLCQRRQASFTVSLFVRNDVGEAAADPLKIEVMRRLNPDPAPYAEGVIVTPQAIAADEEIADADAVRIDMAFDFTYRATEWKLTE